jgi:hypothetical protein
MQFSASFCYFLSLTSKYFPQHLLLKHPQPMFCIYNCLLTWNLFALTRPNTNIVHSATAVSCKSNVLFIVTSSNTILSTLPKTTDHRTLKIYISVVNCFVSLILNLFKIKSTIMSALCRWSTTPPLCSLDPCCLAPWYHSAQTCRRHTSHLTYLS